MRGADHGLTEEPMRQAYTALLFNWLREMVFGAQKATAAAPVAAARAAGRQGLAAEVGGEVSDRASDPVSRG